MKYHPKLKMKIHYFSLIIMFIITDFNLFVFQYNIKKKEEVQEIQQEEPNPLMRKKKTPEELAREAEAEDEDEFTSQSHCLLSLHARSASLLLIIHGTAM